MTAPRNPHGDRDDPRGWGYPGPIPRPQAPVYGWAGYPPAPYGIDPVTGRPLSDKSAAAAGCLQLFFGWFGVGRLYIGSTTIGVIQLCLGLFGFFLFVAGFFLFALTWIIAWPFWLGSAIWAFVDAIMMFTGAVRDGQGHRLR